jgi:hypothetical protein
MGKEYFKIGNKPKSFIKKVNSKQQDYKKCLLIQSLPTIYALYFYFLKFMLLWMRKHSIERLVIVKMHNKKVRKDY